MSAACGGCFVLFKQTLYSFIIYNIIMSSLDKVKWYHPLFVAVPLSLLMFSSDMAQNVSNIVVYYIFGVIPSYLYFAIFKRDKKDSPSE